MRARSNLCRPGRCLAALNRLLREENREPKNPQIQMQLAKFYYKNQAYSRAADAACRAIANHIGDQGEALLLDIIDYYSSTGKQNRAAIYENKLDQLRKNIFVFDQYQTTAKPPRINGQARLPQSAAPLSRKKIIELRRAAQKIMYDDPAKALSLINQAEQAAPASSALLMTKALILIGLADYSAAQTCIEQRQKICNDSVNWNLLGKIQYRMNDLAAAQNHFERALQMQQNSTNYHWLYRILYRQNRFEQAAAAAQAWIRFQTEPKAQLALAEAWRRLNRYQDALDTLDKIEAPWPQKMLCRAYCCMHLQQWQPALEAFEQALFVFRHTPDQEDNDSRTRLAAGYIFLYDYLTKQDQSFGALFTAIQTRAAEAANWLRAQKPAQIGDYQKHDYISAMNMVLRHKNLQIPPDYYQRKISNRED